MGRQAFLTRLALGRSAFEAPDESSASTEAQGNEEQSDAYVQQYDTRGNPINPKATARNLAQIEAKNQVLAAVGVVEKRDAPNDATSDPITFSEEEWDVLMEVENQYGSSIEYWARIAHDATHWWPKTVRRRLQVGLDARLPFHRIVVGEWSMMRSLGPIRGLSYFTAGVVPGTLRRFIEPWAEGLTGELCLVTEQAIIRSRMTPTWQPIWLDLVHAAGDLLSGVTQVALVTFDLFSLLQQLHLFPPQRLVFPLTALLPWHSSSPYNGLYFVARTHHTFHRHYCCFWS
ncbi:hypothetical protein H2203_003966 [Taxawa tesnikishii (nom. ined.)]|nr:hypothetical protein H2203_003966 [Dothideales sp. JES 119]